MTDDRNDLIDGEYDSLFGGEKLPSLFNKTHGVGSELSGIITKAPEDRQSRFYKAGGAGALKFWAPQGSTKPVTDQPETNGKPNRPCMDTVFVLATDYRMTPAELAKREMDDDDGSRGVFASGAQLKAIRDAIRKSGARSRQQLVGARLTLTRTGQKVKGEFEVWEWDARLELNAAPVAADDGTPAPF